MLLGDGLCQGALGPSADSFDNTPMQIFRTELVGYLSTSLSSVAIKTAWSLKEVRENWGRKAICAMKEME